MKRLLLILSAVVFPLISFSQQKYIDAKNYQLKNGLKVILCRDTEKPEIYGAVSINVGSINDPADATGMAHYFEHIMFKGTNKIGTLNWEEEKIYLDSISYYYDRLHDTNNKKERNKIQLKINELSQKAAQYAIPNETDAILSKMGGKGINAFTGLENTVYLNSFPSNQLHKWLEVYAERFRTPVFRLFQSELETVYEEKNMYQDNPISIFMEDILKETFGEHPYGRPVIGYTEHLKNPQISKMQKFFNTYYVTNNMTLILVGDLEFEPTMQLIEETFGELHFGQIPDFPEYKLPTFTGATIVEKRQTPIKLGIIGFNTVPVNHDDNLAIDIMSEILSNSTSTGLLDQLSLNYELLIAMPIPLAMKQHGVFAFMYIPKILGQSHQEAEALIFNCIDSLKTGNFNDDLFQAVKMEKITSEIRKVEGYANTFNMILGYQMNGKSWKDYYTDLDKIKALTKDDIEKVANKYFGDDYLLYRSKMGSADKDKIDKPDWKPIEIKNTDAQSDFAKMIDNETVEPIIPQVIDFNSDVNINETNRAYKVYSTKNPYNDIFTMKIYYNYGNYYNKHLSNAAEYVNLQGTEDSKFQDFHIKLQLLGASINLHTELDRSYINITGFDKDFEEIMELCNQKFFNTGNDEKTLSVLLENHQVNIRLMKRDASSCADAVYNYALFGDDSEYLRMPTSSEIEKYTGEELINYVREIFDYVGFVTYSGNINPETIYNILKKNNFIREEGYKKYPGESIPIEKNVTEDAVYYVHGKKFLQSNIHFFVPGLQMNTQDRNKILSKCFNQYFGGDMYSIVFQEIREFRSLGYSAYSRYLYDIMNRKPSYLYGYLGTQSDKTIEGIDAMHSLIVDIPKKEDKYNTAKESLLAVERSNYIDFRTLPYQVYLWRLEKYDEDPRAEMIKVIESVEFNDVLDFYDEAIKNKPVIISLSGNSKRFKKNDLSKFGKVNKVKMSDIFCE
ncbi:MAG: insulinase family protein [Bacteroidales bacterium]|jgi:predicted Zn-dependent peptidase|nr:insulinase family protein [Bacteroidales bacterium]